MFYILQCNMNIMKVKRTEIKSSFLIYFNQIFLYICHHLMINIAKKGYSLFVNLYEQYSPVHLIGYTVCSQNCKDFVLKNCRSVQLQASVDFCFLSWMLNRCVVSEQKSLNFSVSQNCTVLFQHPVLLRIYLFIMKINNKQFLNQNSLLKHVT